MSSSSSNSVGRGRKEILRHAGYPERKWVTCGYDPKKGTLWRSRPATEAEWKERWENYADMQDRLMVRRKEINT